MRKVLIILFVIVAVVLGGTYLLVHSLKNPSGEIGSSVKAPVPTSSNPLISTSPQAPSGTPEPTGVKTITPGTNEITLRVTTPADGSTVTSSTVSVQGV